MRFTKMQGIGNDYVYVNGAAERVEDAPALARRISDRHFGVGSDGLILINPSERADFEMEMYNADGSRGRMCGNGIRCVGKYVYDKGLTDKTRITVETLAGIRTLDLAVKDGRVDTVRVDMGSPEWRPERIPVLWDRPADRIAGENFRAAGRDWDITCVSMGNPHCVVPEPRLEQLDLPIVGRAFELSDIFPEKVNTEFIRVENRAHVTMRVWERGSGETLACGTGACAVAAACILRGWTDRKVKVSLPGGDLLIEWNEEDDTIYMTGPARTVFEGEW